MTLPVFVVINEWTAEDNSTGAAIVDGVYYETMDGAHDALAEIAELFEVHLEAGETSVQLEDVGRLQYDEYYIQELTRG